MLKSIGLFRSVKNQRFEKPVLRPNLKRAEVVDKPPSLAETQALFSSKPAKPQQKKSEPLNLESESSKELTKKLNEELGTARNVKDYGKVIIALLAEAERKPQQFNLVHLSCFFNKLAKALRQGCDFAKLDQVEKEALAGLSRKAIDFLAGIDRTNGQTIACLMYGFEVLPAELRSDFLVALQKKIPSIEDLDGQAIGNALYGLKNMSEVPQELLTSLAAKIPSIEDFDGQAIGNALYGLKNMNEVPQELLTSLAAKIPSIEDLDGQAIGNALYGLKNMNEVPQELLKNLAVKIPSITDFTGQGIGNALYGLQGMSEVPQELLKNLAAKIPSIEDFTGQNIGNAIHGILNLEKIPRILITNLQAKVKEMDDLSGEETKKYLSQLARIIRLAR